MEYLTESQIKEDSFIMIEFRDGKKMSFLVCKKKVINFSSAIILLGFLSEELLKKCDYFLPFSESKVSNQGHMTLDGAPRKDSQVCGYRVLNEQEKLELKKIIQETDFSQKNYKTLLKNLAR